MAWKTLSHTFRNISTFTTFVEAFVLSGYQFLCSDVTKLLRLHTPSRSNVGFHLLVIVKLLSDQMILEMQKEIEMGVCSVAIFTAVIYFPLSLVCIFNFLTTLP